MGVKNNLGKKRQSLNSELPRLENTWVLPEYISKNKSGNVYRKDNCLIKKLDNGFILKLNSQEIRNKSCSSAITAEIPLSLTELELILEKLTQLDERFGKRMRLACGYDITMSIWNERKNNYYAIITACLEKETKKREIATYTFSFAAIEEFEKTVTHFTI